MKPRRSTNGQAIGEVADGVWYRAVRGSVHRHRRLNAWGFDVKTWLANRSRVTHIIVHDTEAHIRYATTKEHMDRYGRIDYFVDAQGQQHGAQKFLALKHWVAWHDRERRPELPSPPEGKKLAPRAGSTESLGTQQKMF